MENLTGIDWEDAFSNTDYIKDGHSYPDFWKREAASFRSIKDWHLDISYGGDPREKYDLFLPDQRPKGLILFLHGGYWLAFDKSSWSNLASGPLSHGWAVAIPNYTLAPEATIPKITAQIGRAVNSIAQKLPGPICLVGHSAGGHLASRMVCEDTPLSNDVAKRVKRVISISGIHDLRPLLLHSMNSTLRLTENVAVSESPIFKTPLHWVEVTAWIGGAERPEFLRQSALLVENWRLAGAKIELVVDSCHQHFSVINGLKCPNHRLCQRLIGN